MTDDNETGAVRAGDMENIASVAAPSVDEMIEASFSDSGSNARDTTLDEFRIAFESGGSESAEPIATVTVDDAPKKRGRPRGSGTGARKKADIARELEQVRAELEAVKARSDSDKIDNLANQVSMACYLVFGVVAKKRGKHWNLTKDEGEQIGQTGALALAPYADKFEKEAPWVMFALAIGGAVYQRVERDKELVAALPQDVA